MKENLNFGGNREKKGLGGKGDIQSFQAIVAPLSPQQMLSELDTAGFVGVDFSWWTQKGCCRDTGHLAFTSSKRKLKF